ncbi:hypothetical protein FRC00_014209 [Tulasnella sp. 408]|nr:hypothetical protein FRC00_014209 [Tulasnella sp. 408]
MLVPQPQCKQSKLKVNRGTPCDKCIEQMRDYEYNPPNALTKVYVQEAFGGSWLRCRSESIPQSTPLVADLFALATTGGNASLPPAIVTFSRPPPQIPNPSGNNIRRSADAKVSLWSYILPSVVSLATRVFQANSIVVSHHVLAQLRVWQRLLGWEPRPANEGSIPAAPIRPTASAGTGETEGERDEGGSSSRTEPKKTDNHSVFVTAPPSEIEYYDKARPKDLSVLALAHEVFITPAITPQQRVGRGPADVRSSYPPPTYSALNLGSSSDSTSSSEPPSFPERGAHVPYDFSALNSGSSSDSTSSSQPPSFSGLGAPRLSRPFDSKSPQHNVLPLITPQIVLQYLPSKAWREAFLHEFDTLMVNHDGVGASGRRSFLKERIELMLEWADGITSNEITLDEVDCIYMELYILDPVTGSKNTSPFSFLSAHGRGNGTTRSRSGTSGKALPPPPTVGLFAVASAVYALGALSYASKSIHGKFPEDEDDEDNGRGAGNAAEPPLATTGAPPGESMSMPPPSLIPRLEGEQTRPLMNPSISSLHPSSINFSLTGDPTSGSASSSSGRHFLEPPKRELVTSKLNPHIHPLPDKDTPSNLFNLARAALLVHDESALPPSLDYLHAHMLTWLYLLHPSDCASSVTSCRFEGASAGVGSGGMTVVEEMIYKDLGKCVSMARRMGLDLVDRPSAKLRGRAFGCGEVGDPVKNEGMGVWEKEMRRRVWWQLMMFDQQISENLGTLPLIPPGTYACKPPSSADELVFGPMATAIPKPPETACDLHITANVFLLRLWLPFINEALSACSQSNHGVLLTATTTANAIVVASHHLVTRFRAARPMSFGHYDFGNSLWFATGILASVATMRSDATFSSIARRGVEIAGALFQNQVLAGKRDSGYVPKFEVNKLMGHITRLVGEAPKDKMGVGSKRKLDADLDQMNMCYGVPLPYVGTAAMTSATNINVPQAQSALRPESNIGWRRGLPHLSDNVCRTSATPTRPRRRRNLNPGPPPDYEQFHPISEGFAGAASTLTNDAPGSRESSVASHSRMIASQPTSFRSGKNHPSIGIRRRRLWFNRHGSPSPLPSEVDPPSDSGPPLAQALASGGHHSQKAQHRHGPPPNITIRDYHPA